MSIQYYQGEMGPEASDEFAFRSFASREQLQDFEEEWGCGGGEIEYDDESGLYRCPDFCNTWRAFPNVSAAYEYYNELAR